MKNIFKTLLVVLVLFTISSCDENEQPYYDGTGSDAKTFIAFTKSTYNLPVVIDDAGSVTLTIIASTLSDSDRTYNLVLDAENTTADASTYALPSTVTIPANSYEGTMTVNGMDNNLVEPQAKQIVFSLSGFSDNESTDVEDITVNVFEICPVPEDYLVGNYILDDSNGNFGTGVPVTVSIGNDPTVRQFVATFLPGSGVDQDVNVTINLVCNTFVLDAVNINVTCQQGGPGFIIDTAGANNSSYSLADDLLVTVNYTEDPLQSCGAPSIQYFTLTKL